MWLCRLLSTSFLCAGKGQHLKHLHAGRNQHLSQFYELYIQLCIKESVHSFSFGCTSTSEDSNSTWCLKAAIRYQVLYVTLEGSDQVWYQHKELPTLNCLTKNDCISAMH